MGFSAKQTQALKRDLDQRHVRTREAHGRQLSYLEGWYVISEANRIFGFDGWSRETVEARCVLTREVRGAFLTIYIARVRLTVHTNGHSLIREGHGSGEGRGESAAEVHDIAVKRAETDATKRALTTFGKPFGLELYRSDKDRPVAFAAADKAAATIASASPALVPAQSSALPNLNGGQARSGAHPDDATPIPRPSRYYGRRQGPTINDHFRNERRQLSIPAATPPLAPDVPEPVVGDDNAGAKIDKSVLALPEPKRLRDKNHLRFVATQPCLVCGRQPCDPHHLRFAQPRAIGMKVSDEFTVPLCRGHHRQLHQVGDERAWWQGLKIEPLSVARELWEQTHPRIADPDARRHEITDKPGALSTQQAAADRRGPAAPTATTPSPGRNANER
jgi:hypothetical protein